MIFSKKAIQKIFKSYIFVKEKFFSNHYRILIFTMIWEVKIDDSFTTKSKINPQCISVFEGFLYH